MKKLGFVTAAIALGISSGVSQTGGKTLVYGASGQPVSLAGICVIDGNSIYVQQQIYDRLIDFKSGTANLEPSLATSWAANKDATVWTFKLRSGIKFHDGTAFNADAVKFNFERVWDDKNPYSYSACRANTVWADFFGGFKSDTANSLVKNIKVVDNLTVQFELARPTITLPDMLASGYFGIGSPTAMKKAGENYGTPAGLAVGTGPFIIKSWQTGDRVVLEKNKNYWKSQAKVDTLIMRFITEPAARLAAIKSGEIDFASDFAPEALSQLGSDKNLKAVFRPSFNVGYLALNPYHKPFADVRVRQAIAMAINKKEIVKAFWGDLGKTSGHFLPDVLSWGSSPKVTDYKFDPAAAKKMLADAGYPNGFEMDLWYMPVSRPYFPTPKPIAEAMAADLAAIGVKVKLNTKDWAAYLADRKKAPGFNSFMLGWTGDYGHPSNFFDTHFSRGSTDDIGNFTDPKLISLMEQAQKTTDRAKQSVLYRQVDEMVFNLALRIPIVHSQPLLAQRANLTGWIPSPLGSESFENIDKK